MNFFFATVIQTNKKLNAYLDCFILEACITAPNSQQKSSGMIPFLQGKYYRTAMSLNRYEWLMRTMTLHRFARMRWFLTEFEKGARKYYQHTEFVVIDETLRNFYASYNCDFKVYMMINLEIIVFYFVY